MMNLDRSLAITGIIVSAMGVLFCLGKFSFGWILFISGLLLCLYAVRKIYSASPVTKISRSHLYEFKDPAASIVESTRIGVYQINAKNVTMLRARCISATGELKKFRTNVGTLKIDEASGGGLCVRVDLDRPPKPRSELTWILSFEGHNCFAEKHESVSYTALEKWENGTLSIRFHPDRFPQIVKKTLYSGGKETVLEEVSLTKELPSIDWDFKPKRGEDYLLQWTWPDVSD